LNNKKRLSAAKISADSLLNDLSRKVFYKTMRFIKGYREA